ncbi:MAG: hypothetical protein V1837_07170 [Candidatus Woesearchaeota archaeon]
MRSAASQDRKAQSISLNTIIIAILALLVLVVIALIFSGKIKVFGTETRSCANVGGTCETACESNEAEQGNTNCVNKCCIDIYTTADDNND